MSKSFLIENTTIWFLCSQNLTSNLYSSPAAFLKEKKTFLRVSRQKKTVTASATEKYFLIILKLPIITYGFVS